MKGKKDKERLHWKDYFALTIAMLTTTLLPVLILAILLLVVLVIISAI